MTSRYVTFRADLMDELTHCQDAQDMTKEKTTTKIWWCYQTTFLYEQGQHNMLLQ